MSEDLNTANIQRLADALKALRKEHHELADKVSSLQNTVTMQQTEMQRLRQQVAIIRATTIGGGPTSVS